MREKVDRISARTKELNAGLKPSHRLVMDHAFYLQRMVEDFGCRLAYLRNEANVTSSELASDMGIEAWRVDGLESSSRGFDVALVRGYLVALRSLISEDAFEVRGTPLDFEDFLYRLFDSSLFTDGDRETARGHYQQMAKMILAVDDRDAGLMQDAFTLGLDIEGLGLRLASLREDQDLSSSQVADILGVEVRRVDSLESGRAPVDLDLVRNYLLVVQGARV